MAITIGKPRLPKNIRVTFSAHAKTRLTLREVTQSEAILTVLEPDHYHITKDNCWLAYKKIAGKNIKVIYEMRSSTHAHIVTLKKNSLSL